MAVGPPPDLFSLRNIGCGQHLPVGMMLNPIDRHIARKEPAGQNNAQQPPAREGQLKSETTHALKIGPAPAASNFMHT